MPVGTIGAALLTGAAAGGVNLLGRGAGWLIGGGRAAKKAREAELAAAKKEYRKGERQGWGPSVRQKNMIVNRARQDVDQAARSDLQDIQRMEAAQGFGRSGLLGMQRTNISENKQKAIAQARAAVETNARKEAAMERQASLARLSAARGAQQVAASQAAQAGAEVGSTVAGAVLGSYQSGMAQDIAANSQMRHDSRIQGGAGANQTRVPGVEDENGTLDMINTNDAKVGAQ
jgi:hypothetical protein